MNCTNYCLMDSLKTYSTYEHTFVVNIMNISGFIRSTSGINQVLKLVWGSVKPHKSHYTNLIPIRRAQYNHYICMRKWVCDNKAAYLVECELRAGQLSYLKVLCGLSSRTSWELAQHLFVSLDSPHTCICTTQHSPVCMCVCIPGWI